MSLSSNWNRKLSKRHFNGSHIVLQSTTLGNQKSTISNFTLSGFLLMGFSGKLGLELILASLFLVIYMDTLIGNMLIITVASRDSNHHAPLYFFLNHLSFLNPCYISMTVPRYIYNSFKQNGYIPMWECIVQCFVFILCDSAELSILTVMPYDRYMAICFPLCHEIIMDARTCIQGVLDAWTNGFISGTMHTTATFSMHFCGPHAIHQFFCDIPQFLKLSCSDEYMREVGATGFLLLMAFSCIVFIVISYTKIFSTILRMPYAEERAKVFSTCLPHFVVALLLITTCVFEFFKPPSDSPSALDIFLTIMYTVVPPTFNPIIYSLRNQVMKKGFPTKTSLNLLIRHLC